MSCLIYLEFFRKIYNFDHYAYSTKHEKNIIYCDETFILYINFPKYETYMCLKMRKTSRSHLR